MKAKTPDRVRIEKIDNGFVVSWTDPSTYAAHNKFVETLDEAISNSETVMRTGLLDVVDVGLLPD